MAEHFDQIVEASTQVFIGDSLAVQFDVLPVVPPDLLWAFQSTRYDRTARTDGLVTQSKVIGFLPRVTLRRDFCTESSLARTQSAQHQTFLNYAIDAAVAFKKANPSLYAAQRKQVEGVLPEWRLPNAPVFTSGIVNHDNALRYHFDSGNFSGAWSCMYALSKDCAGGLLVVPSLRLAFRVADGIRIFFDGQHFLHGVTSLDKRSAFAYRYSCVFYGMKQMCNCLPAAEELKRVQNLRVQRERKRASAT